MIVKDVFNVVVFSSLLVLLNVLDEILPVVFSTLQELVFQ
jgi:hypothetical protein